MASHPPSECCLVKSIHEGTAAGTYKELFGLDTYQIGEQNGNDKIVVILTDVFGYKFNNTLLLADEIAKHGFHVLVPDILKGDPVDGSVSIQTWLDNHPVEENKTIVNNFLSGLRSGLKPKFVGGIGHCFGAKYAIQNLAADGHLDAVAVAHPSFVAIGEVSAVAKPLLISAAETDSNFTDELRHATEAELKKIGATYQIDLFSGVVHGYAVKGDLSNPKVKYAKEKTLLDQIYWFKYFSSL